MSIEDFKTAIVRSDREGVNRAAAALLAQSARLGGLWSGIVRALTFNGELALAERAARAGVSQRGDPADIMALATTLLEAGQPHRALQAIGPLAGAGFGPAIEHFAGVCALQLGDFETARARFSAAVALEPRAGPSWFSLAALPPSDDRHLLEQLRRVIERTPLAPAEQAPLHYACGTLLERLGDHDAAFAAIDQGASLARPGRPYDRQGDADEAAALMAMDAGQLASLRSASSSGIRPIFVSGAPRSGTTLVEQILASHSAVSGGGETSFGRIVTSEIGGRDGRALAAYRDRKGGLADVERLYQRLAEQRFGGPCLVDKSLNLGRMAGVYAAIFPDAPMIWLDRDPLDVAWSNYRTWFARGADWSFALEDMAHHLALEHRLADHWQAVLGDRFLRVSYAALVAEPAATIARIAAHCALPFEPAMLTPHQTRRAVTSASFFQVRQPINRTGIGSAQHVARQLAPFAQAYAETGGAPGG
ncbi:sulfotransferase [Sphingomonas sp. S1-29]|uniref:tetratricopeptide repeat-containing sulfotransferase family protein n=1 Tax=Sphingomonas sp. S1-29 TaxID=2991074 RepID=UPI00223F9195|nr:tetratricopeptide repeat-containing sulfotransferase family protein [Sphingomonas sp. S1-29]UZK68104.1 sulfotransferase [Sphingomonas sp. S1-29]